MPTVVLEPVPVSAQTPTQPGVCRCGGTPEIDPAVGVGCPACWQAVYLPSDKTLAWAIEEWNSWMEGGR